MTPEMEANKVKKPLIARYDGALFDLDGVVYLGPWAVAGAVEGLAELRARGVRLGFVTNNAARAPQVVVDHLVELGIAADTADVVTSAQAGARLLAESVSAGSLVLVVGTEALAAEVRAVGLEPTTAVDPLPAAVIQGYHPNLPWELIDRAAYAIQQGAQWIATNTDANRPTDRGLVPGAGAQIGALRNAVTVDPQVAGKPFAPLMHETVRRLEATRPIFVGDRIDTDVAGAAGIGIDSLLVLSGAHGKRQVIAAVNRPTHIGWDLRALLDPAPVIDVGVDTASCGGVEVRRVGERFVLPHTSGDRDTQLSAFRALVALVEPGADPDQPGLSSILESLDLIP